MFKTKIAGKKRVDRKTETENKAEKLAKEMKNNLELIFEAEEELRIAIRVLNKKAIELTKLNALQSRGPVNLEDTLHHNLISQETLNADYNYALEEYRKRFEQEYGSELQD